MRSDFFLPVAIAGLLALMVLGPQTEADPPSAKAPGPNEVYGRIQFVSSFPDCRVQVVNSFPDLKVQMVTSFPDQPGKWQKVSSFPDYRVQVVDSFPDFTIRYVDSFPGPAK